MASSASKSDSTQKTTNENVSVYAEEGSTAYSMRDGGVINQAVTAEELELFKAVLGTAQDAGAAALNASNQATEQAMDIIRQEGENDTQSFAKMVLPITIFGAIAYVVGKVVK